MSFYEVYVDGASRGQGIVEDDGTVIKRGHGAIGVMIYENRKLVGQYARGIGRVPSSVAEYEAILLGITICWASSIPNPTIYSDSADVVNQINGDWECNNEDLIPLLLSAQDLREVYNFRLIKVPRHNVAETDALVNEFLDKLLEPVNKSKKKKKKRNKNIQKPI